MVRLYEIELEYECKYGKNPDDDYQVLIEACRKYIKDLDEDLIKKAFYFNVQEFKEILRISGDPYYTHPLKVALILINDIGFVDNQSVVAALLHDTVEDIPAITKEYISGIFGEEIAEIVDGVTKIKGEKTRKLDKAATYSKLFESLIKDVRVILIKLADRLDNLRTLHYLYEHKQKVIAQETLNFYTPFAQRLGLIRVKKLLEDLSLYFIDRKIYDVIKDALANKQIEFVNIIASLEQQINKTLDDKNIGHALAIEHKHVYEIYKMLEQGRSLSEIDNFFSIVIKLDTNDFSECYRAYGIITNLFGPVRTFEDYFSKPKINFYRALHSTHFGPKRKIVEVIIRTEEMDMLVEQGMAGKFSINEATKNLNIHEEDLNEWIKWMQNVVNEGEEDAIQKIWGTIKMNLYEDYQNIYTTDRKVYALPLHSCPIDLAFNISDYVGYHCISAKVNGEIKNLRYELQNDDTVEILTSPNSKPDTEWKDFVVSIKAVIKLYEYFKNLPPEKQISQNLKKSLDVKFRIIGEDRAGMLNEITKAIGQINIQRINLFKTSDAQFEGVFTLSMVDEELINTVFTRLFSIKGLRAVERIEEEEE